MKRSVYLLIIISLLVFWFCKAKKNPTTSSNKTDNVVVIPPPPLDVTEGLNLGNRAPEITQKNTRDSLISLSSTRGNIVLLDFWASWCGPCRYENPNVVSAYEKYKSAKFINAKGFTVFSVSFDSNKTLWVKAIDKDQLNWPWHVSDLMGWNNAAGLVYFVREIPTNYLLDANGIILAKNLRGDALETALEKLIVKDGK